MDERNKQIAYKVIAIMYFLTLLSIQFIVLYRQFALGQTLSEFEDIAIIMSVNSLFLISALLYFGAIPIRKLKIKTVLLFYFVLIVLGSLITYVKYKIFASPGLSFKQLFDKIIIVVVIIGLLMGFWIVLSLVGKKRIDNELE